MDFIQFAQGSILVSGGFFALFWGVNLFFLNSNLKIMSYILWIASLWLFSGAYIFTGFHLQFPYFYCLHLPFVYLLGPLFYLYYKQIILEEHSKNFLIHSIPFFIVGLAIVPYHFFSLESKIHFLNSIKNKEIGMYSLILFVLNVGTKISLLGYMSVILWENKTIFKQNETITNKTKIVFLFMTSLLYIDLFLGLLGFLFQSFLMIKISAILLPANLYLFFVASARYPEMISGIQKEMKKAKYEQSKIKNLDVEEILLKIKLIMETEKAFADEDITLSALAADLEISTHQLSQILNEKLNQTFPQFINEYRVQEAKKIILEEKKRQFLSIAFAVGFNSKASFNRAFKQITGITPQEFKKNYS